jgi:Sulfotransferase family
MPDAILAEAGRKPPVFIIGNPRSGTTLLRLMLTCHPHLVIPPEGGFAVWLHDEYHAWSREDGRSPEAIALFVRAVLACRKMET